MDIRYYFPTAKGEIVKWCKTQPDIEAALAACEHGDWIIYAAAQLDVDTRLIVLAAARCADAVRHLMTDPQSIAAVDLALRYGAGDCITAAEAASEASEAAAREVWEAAWAALAAVEAASEAREAVEAAWEAVEAARAEAAWAAWEATSTLSSEKVLQSPQKIATICRETLGKEILQKLTGGKNDV